MKEFNVQDFDALIVKGYGLILSLPSYAVIQHPGTFHTIIFLDRKTRGPRVYKIIKQYNLPGLSNDPDVVIPAGMWRELLKMSNTGTERRYRDENEPALGRQPGTYRAHRVIIEHPNAGPTGGAPTTNQIRNALDGQPRDMFEFEPAEYIPQHEEE